MRALWPKTARKASSGHRFQRGSEPRRTPLDRPVIEDAQHVESLRDETGAPLTRIHTIGFFLERDGTEEWFLRELSLRTGGLYVGWRGERLSAR